MNDSNNNLNEETSYSKPEIETFSETNMKNFVIQTLIAVVITAFICTGINVYVTTISNKHIMELEESISKKDEEIENIKKEEIESLLKSLGDEDDYKNVGLIKVHSNIIRHCDKLDDYISELMQYGDLVRKLNNSQCTSADLADLNAMLDVYNKCLEENEILGDYLGLDNASLGDNIYYMAVASEMMGKAEEFKKEVGSVNGNENSAKMVGIRPEFKKAIDEYEKFFDEYCECLNSYDASDFSVASNYVGMMYQFSKSMQALEEIKTEDLSNEELEYYLEAMQRINRKLANVHVK